MGIDTMKSNNNRLFHYRTLFTETPCFSRRRRRFQKVYGKE